MNHETSNNFESKIFKNYSSMGLLNLDEEMNCDIRLADIELDSNLLLAVHRT